MGIHQLNMGFSEDGGLLPETFYPKRKDWNDCLLDK